MIKDIMIDLCCSDKFIARREHVHREMAKSKALEEVEVEEEINFGPGFFAPYQKVLYNLLEKPQSSTLAKFLSLWSIFLVLISTTCMCINTFPWMQSQDINGEPVDNPKMALVEAFCISYFSLEFLVRLAGAPQKIAFLKETMNIVDMLAIAPYYLTLFLLPPPNLDLDADRATTQEEESGLGNAGRIMQVFRIARIMRIFKLARRSVGLQSMAYTVKNSWQDLFLLASLIMIGMLVFGSVEFFIEGEEEDTGFYSIPQGMWWAVQTLTSLGYGDFWPETIPGKLVGSMCAVSGVLVLALPIPIVVDNFADYYKEQKQLEAREFRRDARALQEEEEREMAKTANEGLVETICQQFTSSFEDVD